MADLAQLSIEDLEELAVKSRAEMVAARAKFAEARKELERRSSLDSLKAKKAKLEAEVDEISASLERLG